MTAMRSRPPCTRNSWPCAGAAQQANPWPTSRGARSSMACRWPSTPACSTRAPTPKPWSIGRSKCSPPCPPPPPRTSAPPPAPEPRVDWALEVLAPLPAPRVLDLGTGSGAIALALQRHCPGAWILAIDASADALAVARANAGRLGLPVQLAQGHWLSGAPAGFDAIVSNPPYLGAQDPHLAALAHEPRQALVSGADGLQDIRSIIGQAPGHLTAGGWLLLEHGHDQAAAVHALLSARGFARVQSRADLAGIARCSGGQWNHRSRTESEGR